MMDRIQELVGTYIHRSIMKTLANFLQLSDK